MKEEVYFSHMKNLLETAPCRELTEADRIVIFSDLHMGNGTRKDDFFRNSDIFQAALSAYYWENSYSLILNGDIEELQKFNPAKIRKVWEEIFLLFERFRTAGRLLWIWGNHDELLAFNQGKEEGKIIEAFKYLYKGSTIFVFHGHQTKAAYVKFNRFVGLLAKYILRPLGIMNDSVAHDNRKKFKTERRVYEFSISQKILSITGHTHRALFESLSKGDLLRFRIEDLCRRYPVAGDEEKRKIETEVDAVKGKLRVIMDSDNGVSFQGSIYESHFMIPCVFNSGSATGARGITCLEISGGQIRLVQWSDRNVGLQPLSGEGTPVAEKLGDSDYSRVVLQEESLDYIFSRINLLA